MPIVIAYIPVLHRGYLAFLQQHANAQILVLGEDVVGEFPHLQKDVRALNPTEVVAALNSLGFDNCQLATAEKLTSLQSSDEQIFMPDEDIMHDLAEKYLREKTVTFENVFLRWDKKRSLAKETVNAEHEISQEEFDKKMMALAFEQSDKSADWWRHVGAVLVKDGQVLLTAYNHHVPHEQQPYFEGDVRGNFHKGTYIELSTAMHAEAEIICSAAKQGLSVEGCELYATTFPCPVCAKLIAYSGIKTVFFAEGYAMVDGERIMKDRGVKIVKVQQKEKNVGSEY